MPTIEKITEGCIIGEGPHWDVANQCLYFVHPFNNNIVKYTPATKKLTKGILEKKVSIIIPIEGKKDEFVVTQDNELVRVSWDGENDKVSIIEKLYALEAPETFNDAKCDSLGRLWIGSHILDADFTKTKPLGALWSLDADRQFKRHSDKIHCANGMAFDDKRKKMYFIDSLTKWIYQFDFDLNNGTISNKQPWFTPEKFNIPGFPDGMSIDSEGNLWIATFEGRGILKISGDKKETLLDVIELPTNQVTSLAFGGENLDELYVTTASFDGVKFTPLPNAKGTTYRVAGIGVKGLPAKNFKLN